MQASSEDLRERVICAVEAGRPREGVAARFEVSVKTAGLQVALPERLAEQADATLEEHCSWCEARSGCEVSTATMSRALARPGVDAQKRTLRASEQDPMARAAWRADTAAPRNPGENKTVVTVLSLDGVRALMCCDGGRTSDRSIGYGRHVLALTLRPGQVVIADNLRAHHPAGARAAIEARGVRLHCLPPYSPDCNPIEHTFSKVK